MDQKNTDVDIASTDTHTQWVYSYFYQGVLDDEQVFLLHAVSLLCNELAYHFQISNLGVSFQKGIHQKLIRKAIGLTLIPA